MDPPSYTVGGYALALQIWVVECFPEFTPDFAALQAGLVMFPRMLCWKVPSKLSYIAVHRKFIEKQKIRGEQFLRPRNDAERTYLRIIKCSKRLVVELGLDPTQALDESEGNDEPLNDTQHSTSSPLRDRQQDCLPATRLMQSVGSGPPPSTIDVLMEALGSFRTDVLAKIEGFGSKISRMESMQSEFHADVLAKFEECGSNISRMESMHSEFRAEILAKFEESGSKIHADIRSLREEIQPILSSRIQDSMDQLDKMNDKDLWHQFKDHNFQHGMGDNFQQAMGDGIGDLRRDLGFFFCSTPIEAPLKDIIDQQRELHLLYDSTPMEAPAKDNIDQQRELHLHLNSTPMEAPVKDNIGDNICLSHAMEMDVQPSDNVFTSQTGLAIDINTYDEEISDTILVSDDSLPLACRREKRKGAGENPHLREIYVTITPKRHRTSPLQFDLYGECIDTEQKDAFMKWLHGDVEKDRSVNLGIADVKQMFFKELHKLYTWIKSEHVECYLYLLRQRMQRHPTLFPKKVSILDPWFTKRLLTDSVMKAFASDIDGYIWEKKLMQYVIGPNHAGMLPWKEVDEVYCVLNMLGTHWVALRISIAQWSIQVYDNDPSIVGPDKLHERMNPICCALPCMLRQAQVFSHLLRVNEHPLQAFTYERVGSDICPCSQYSGNCGIYALKYIELLVSGRDLMRVTDDQMDVFRLQMCVDLFHQNFDP